MWVGLSCNVHVVRIATALARNKRLVDHCDRSGHPDTIQYRLKLALEIQQLLIGEAKVGIDQHEPLARHDAANPGVLGRVQHRSCGPVVLPFENRVVGRVENDRKVAVELGAIDRRPADGISASRSLAGKRHTPAGPRLAHDFHVLLLRAAELGGGAGLTFLRRRGLYFGHLRYLAALDRVVEVPLVLVDHALHRSALDVPVDRTEDHVQYWLGEQRVDGTLNRAAGLLIVVGDVAGLLGRRVERTRLLLYVVLGVRLGLLRPRPLGRLLLRLLRLLLRLLSLLRSERRGRGR